MAISVSLGKNKRLAPHEGRPIQLIDEPIFYIFSHSFPPLTNKLRIYFMISAKRTFTIKMKVLFEVCCPSIFPKIVELLDT